jgi:V/A-type H+-transporting ATPase subunit D
MNLIRFRRTLSFLRRAHALLEEKRDILLLEVSRRLGEATKVRGELNAVLKSAYASQDAAATAVGTEELKKISESPIAAFQVNASNKKIMGVTTLALELTDLKRSLTYSISRPTVLKTTPPRSSLKRYP